MGSVSVGLTIGGIINEGILEYDKSQYERRISQLEGYNRQLNQHLNTLEGYKREIGSFWNDSDAEDAKKLIDINIQKIKKTSERVEEVIKASRGCIEVLDDAKGKTGEYIKESISKISALDDL